MLWRERPPRQKKPSVKFKYLELLCIDLSLPAGRGVKPDEGCDGGKLPEGTASTHAWKGPGAQVTPWGPYVEVDSQFG